MPRDELQAVLYSYVRLSLHTLTFVFRYSTYSGLSIFFLLSISDIHHVGKCHFFLL